MTKTKAEVAKKNEVLFAALRLKKDKKDVQYMTSKLSLISGLGITPEAADGVELYQIAPIPGASLAQQKERPQILALNNYIQARSIAFTLALYLTGKFDPERNKEMTVAQTLKPVLTEKEDVITQRYDAIGTLTIQLADDGALFFTEENGMVLAETHVDKETPDGGAYPQLIYIAIAPSCKIAKFDKLRNNQKYLPIRKKELKLMKLAAEEQQKKISKKS